MATETIQVGAMSVRFRVEGSESNGSVAMFDLLIPADVKLPAPHSHDAYEETIYGLSGTSTWTVDGEAIDVGPGDVLCILRGQIHAFDNRGDEDARALCVVTPGVLSPDYFREANAVFADAAGGPPDLARLGEIMRRHGLTPAPGPS